MWKRVFGEKQRIEIVSSQVVSSKEDTICLLKNSKEKVSDSKVMIDSNGL